MVVIGTVTGLHKIYWSPDISHRWFWNNSNIKAGKQCLSLQGWGGGGGGGELLCVVIRGFNLFVCGACFLSSCGRQRQTNQLADRVQLKKTGDTGGPWRGTRDSFYKYLWFVWKGNHAGPKNRITCWQARHSHVYFERHKASKSGYTAEKR